MDNPVLIIEAPILDDESVVKIYDFLQNLIFAFDAHYYVQLQRYSRKVNQPDGPDYLNDIQGDHGFYDDEIPF